MLAFEMGVADDETMLGRVVSLEGVLDVIFESGNHVLEADGMVDECATTKLPIVLDLALFLAEQAFRPERRQVALQRVADEESELPPILMGHVLPIDAQRRRGRQVEDGAVLWNADAIKVVEKKVHLGTRDFGEVAKRQLRSWSYDNVHAPRVHAIAISEALGVNRFLEAMAQNRPFLLGFARCDRAVNIHVIGDHALDLAIVQAGKVGDSMADTAHHEPICLESCHAHWPIAHAKGSLGAQVVQPRVDVRLPGRRGGGS
mmetsp:Transcript_109101/g.307574  ORF Transcript_109101/g.307574 Transcript_109101/m.307574 type:complete len:260 (+) Transcript_109101:388-1167(+)